MRPGQNTLSISAIIHQQIQAVAEEHAKPVPPLDDSLPLLDCGLDSLCLAILVVRLEDRFGFDPFSGDGPVAFPVTIGDFIEAYERASV